MRAADFLQEEKPNREAPGETSPNPEGMESSLFRMIKFDFPQSKDWPKFSGEGEYDHMEFIDWEDQIKIDMHVPDTLIMSKLSIVFTGLAKLWFQEKRREVGRLSWQEWKEAMIERFGTRKWRRKMQIAFEKDYYSIKNNAEPVKWLVTQRRRLQAAQPDITKEDMMDKILEKCPGDLDHAIRIRLPKLEDFVESTIVFEDVLGRTSLGRSSKPMLSRPQYDNKYSTKATTGEPSKAETKPSTLVRKRDCYNRGSTEHLARDRKKKKAINAIEDLEDEEPEETSVEDIERELMEEEYSEDDRHIDMISVANDEEVRPLSKGRPFFEIRINNTETVILGHTGATCSIIPLELLSEVIQIG